jgi:3-oxoacyl-(acyl-carrier-protein) synthase
MDNPTLHSEPLVRSIEPDYKNYFSSNQVRRMSRILKRALLTSRLAVESAGVEQLDAIVTGTGLGCIESTGLFLDALARQGESLLKPTHFMQSTHNTVSSVVAMDRSCHGYNSTYAHKGISFESALQDSFILLRNGEINTALVGAHDEMTPDYFTFLKRTGYLGHSGDGFAGETALGLMLGTVPSENSLCRIDGVEIRYRPTRSSADYAALQNLLDEAPFGVEEADAVMLGVNGQAANDAIYEEVCDKLFPDKSLLRYKHLFGESYTAPGPGVYAVAVCLAQRRIPAHLFAEAGREERRNIERIIFYNHFEGKNHSFVFLSSCGK